jgi:hypothetical protein
MNTLFCTILHAVLHTCTHIYTLICIHTYLCIYIDMLCTCIYKHVITICFFYIQFDSSMTTFFCIILHAVLSVSSFLFKIPNNRMKTSPMIYPEVTFICIYKYTYLFTCIHLCLNTHMFIYIFL